MTETTMKRKYSYKLFVKICIVFGLMGFKLILCANKGMIFHKTCTTEGTFKMIFGKSFPDCIDECQRRQRCEMVMYKHGIDECNLKDYIGVTSLTEENPVCMFTNTSEWNRKDGSVCTKTSCGVTETCIDSKTDERKFECVVSECSEPRAKDGAKILSNVHDIGSRNCYKCGSEFFKFGDPFITCKSDGDWTENNFVCRKNGTTPTSVSDIADLTSISGEKWLEGTTVTYTCRSNYQGMGNVSINTVDRKGIWRPSCIQCCNENITDYIFRGNECLGFFNVSVAATIPEMKQHCKLIGGYMRTVSIHHAKVALENFNYTTVLSASNKIDHLYQLKKCFTSNNVNNDTSSLTYDDLLKKVKNAGFTTPWQCSIPDWFAPGEPNEGDGKTCFIYKNGTAEDVNCHETWSSDVHFICSYDLPSA